MQVFYSRAPVCVDYLVTWCYYVPYNLAKYMFDTVFVVVYRDSAGCFSWNGSIRTDLHGTIFACDL